MPREHRFALLRLLVVAGLFICAQALPACPGALDVQRIDLGAGAHALHVDTSGIPPSTPDCDLTLSPSAVLTKCAQTVSTTRVRDVARATLFTEDRDAALRAADAQTMILVEASAPFSASMTATGQSAASPMFSLNAAEADVTSSAAPTDDLVESSKIKSSPSEAPLSPSATDVRQLVSRTAIVPQTATTIVVSLLWTKAPAGAGRSLRIVLQCAAVVLCNSTRAEFVREVYPYAQGDRDGDTLPVALMSDTDGAGADVYPSGHFCAWRVYDSPERTAFDVEHVGEAGLHAYTERVITALGPRDLRRVRPALFDVKGRGATQTFPLRASETEEYSTKSTNLRRYRLWTRREPDLWESFHYLVRQREGRQYGSMIRSTVAFGSAELTFSGSSSTAKGGVTVIINAVGTEGRTTSSAMCGSERRSKAVTAIGARAPRIDHPIDGNVTTGPAPAAGSILGGRLFASPNCTTVFIARCGFTDSRGQVYDGGRLHRGQRTAPMGLSIRIRFAEGYNATAFSVVVTSPELRRRPQASWRLVEDELSSEALPVDPQGSSRSEIRRFVTPNTFESYDGQDLPPGDFNVSVSVMGAWNSVVPVTIDAECRALANTCPAGSTVDLQPPEYHKAFRASNGGETRAQPGLTLYSDVDGASEHAYRYVPGNNTCSYRVTCASGVLNVTRVRYNMSMWARVRQERLGSSPPNFPQYIYYRYYHFDALTAMYPATFLQGPAVLPAIANRPPPPAQHQTPDETRIYPWKAAEFEPSGSFSRVGSAAPDDFEKDTPLVGLVSTPLDLSWQRYSDFAGGFDADMHCVPATCQQSDCSPSIAPPSRNFSRVVDYRALPTHVENCTTVVEMGVACVDGENVFVEVAVNAAIDAPEDGMPANSLFVGGWSFPNATVPVQFMHPREAPLVVSHRVMPGQRIKYSIKLSCRGASSTCTAATATGDVIDSALGTGTIVTGGAQYGTHNAKKVESCHFQVACPVSESLFPSRPRLRHANLTVSGNVSMYRLYQWTGSNNAAGQRVYAWYRYYDLVGIQEPPVPAVMASSGFAGAPVSVYLPSSVDFSKDVYGHKLFSDTVLLRTPLVLQSVSRSSNPGAVIGAYECMPVMCRNKTFVPAATSTAVMASPASAQVPASGIGMGVSRTNTHPTAADSCSTVLQLDAATPYVLVIDVTESAGTGSGITVARNRHIPVVSLDVTSSEAFVTSMSPSKHPAEVVVASTPASERSVSTITGVSAVEVGVDVAAAGGSLHAALAVLPALLVNVTAAVCHATSAAAISAPTRLSLTPTGSAESLTATVIFTDIDGWLPGDIFTSSTSCHWAFKCPSASTQHLAISSAADFTSATTNLGFFSASTEQPTAATTRQPQQGTIRVSYPAAADQVAVLSLLSAGAMPGFTALTLCCDTTRFTESCLACREGFRDFPRCTDYVSCSVETNCGGSSRASAAEVNGESSCGCTCKPPFTSSDCSQCENSRHDPAAACAACAPGFRANETGHPDGCLSDIEAAVQRSVARLEELKSAPGGDGVCLAGIGWIEPPVAPAPPSITRTLGGEPQDRTGTTTVAPPPKSTSHSEVAMPPVPTTHAPAAATRTASASRVEPPVPPRPFLSRTVSESLVPAPAAALRGRRVAPVDDALKNKEAATAVVEVGQATVLGTALLSPSLALVGTRNANMVGAALCGFVELQDAEEPFVVFPIQFELPLSDAAPASANRLFGAVVANAVLMMVAALGLWFLRSAAAAPGAKDEGSDGDDGACPMLPIVSSLWVAMSCYFAPNMVRVATTLVVDADPSIASVAVLAVCGFAVPIGSGVVAPAWLLSGSRFTVELRWERRSHVAPSEARPPELLDPLNPSSRPPFSEYKPHYVDRREGDPQVTPALPFVDAFGGLFDGFTDAVRSPARRFTHVIDVALCFAMSALAGLRPTSQSFCGAVALAMLALSVVPVAYFVVLRPFVSRLEKWLVAALALQQLAVGCLVVNVAMRDSSDGALNALGWADVALTTTSLGSLAVIAGYRGYLAYVRRSTRSGVDITTENGSVDAPLLSVPSPTQHLQEGPGAGNPSTNSHDADEGGAEQRSNPLVRS